MKPTSDSGCRVLYDVRLEIGSRYDGLAAAARHHLRVLPQTLAGIQTVTEAALSLEPGTAGLRAGADFFGNRRHAVQIEGPHDRFVVTATARVDVARTAVPATSLAWSALEEALSQVLTLGPASPHHFRTDSPRVQRSADFAAYARDSIGTAGADGHHGPVEDTDLITLADGLARRIHADFAYDPDATAVDTPVATAFDLRRGVCQDFAHVMIAALRSIGVPAGYVSGLLRTTPPPGQPRLEGADAMHAWVRIWAGPAVGWVEFDPTNAMPAGDGHIAIAYGRDYSDVAPIIGIVNGHGTHESWQAVDVIPYGTEQETP